MPVVAVAGAAVAVGVAAEVGTTFAIIAAAGAVVGAVGAVTGIKELQIAGAVVGAVGAIGGLASSAGLFGSAAEGIGGGLSGAGVGTSEAIAAGTTAAETASPFASAGESIDSEIASWSTYGAGGANTALAGAPSIGDNGSWDVVNTVTGSNVPDATPNPLAGVQQNAVSPDVTPTVARMNDPGGVQFDSNGQIIQGDSTPDVTAPVGEPGINPPPAAPEAPAAPDASAATPATTPSTPTADSLINGPANSSNIVRTAGAGTGAADNSWKGVWDFVKSQGGGMLGFGVLQAGSAFISGATSQLTPAQIEALRAQSNANIAAANLSQQQQQTLQNQQANLAQPIPVARRAGAAVTGAPAGLINQPPPTVTGAVA